MSSEISHDSLRYKFSWTEVTKVPESIKEHIRMGLQKVWEDNMGTDREFKVIIAGTLIDSDTNKPTDILAEYDSESDTFRFAMDIIKRQLEGSLDLNVLIIAAHEAFHAVQVALGDPPPLYKGNQNYEDDRHEREAWEAAKKVASSIYPGVYGKIVRNGRVLLEL